MSEYRPIIGIPCRYNWNTFYYELRETYAEAIYAAGGTPLLLPLIPESDFIESVVEHLDAVCLSGAVNDVDPLRYGREPKPHLGPVVPRRDETDILLLAAAEARQLPVLAICFGIQSLNVYRGGTLIQDIDTEVKDPLKHMQGDLFWRRSQAIDIVGRDLEPIAWAPDGVIEAVINTRSDQFVLGVQWHPEVGWQQDLLSQALFNYFIGVARERAPSRTAEPVAAKS